MRWLAVVVALLAMPGLAFAGPRAKVAIAPIDDDTGDAIGAIVVEVAKVHAKVTGIDKTRRAIDDLSVTLDKKGIKKLRVKLEVEVVIHGSVEKDGAKHKLSLELSGHGKARANLELTYKTPKLLKAALAKELPEKLDEVAGTAPATDDEDDEDDKPKVAAEQDKPKPKPVDEDKPKGKAKVADDDKPAPRRVSALGDDDDTSVRAGTEDSGKHRKHHKHVEGVEAPPRDVATQGWILADAGFELARRTLRWSTTGAEPSPPWVGTGGAAAAISGEIYPFASDSLTGAAGLGIYGTYAKVVDVSITLPATGTSVSIDNGHYEIGLRYRLAFGTSSLAFGLGLWKRYYVADRAGLMTGVTLDMPDVNYTAAAPNVLYRFALSSSLAGFGEVEVPLVLGNGQIGSGTSYGQGTIIAFSLQAGIEYLVADHYAIDVAAIYDQVGDTFKAAMNSQAAERGVTGATDKSYGVTAMFGVKY